MSSAALRMRRYRARLKVRRVLEEAIRNGVPRYFIQNVLDGLTLVNVTPSSVTLDQAERNPGRSYADTIAARWEAAKAEMNLEVSNG